MEENIIKHVIIHVQDKNMEENIIKHVRNLFRLRKKMIPN